MNGQNGETGGNIHEEPGHTNHDDSQDHHGPSQGMNHAIHDHGPGGEPAPGGW